MTRLYPALALADGETPESFVGRLALLHNRPARLFCTDLGLTMHAVAGGEPETLSRLEELARLVPGSLASFAVQRLPGSKYNLHGEIFPKTALRRENVFICPSCIGEDISRSPLPPVAAAHDRAIWKLASIRTCPIHDLALVDCGRAGRRDFGDFPSLIKTSLPNLSKLAATAEQRPASSLERYVFQRITHKRQTEWIDLFDLYTLIKFSELTGALQIFGHNVAARSLSPQDWQKAGGIGFDILAQGPAAIEEFISRMWSTYPKVKVPSQGTQAVLGILHQWLRGQTEGQRPFRELIY